MFRASGYYFLGLFALALLAFWKSYVTHPTSFDPYTHAHAVLMVGWFAILIAQPFLIRRERRATHRVLGRISFVLVPCLAASILLLTHVRVRAAPSLPADARFFFLPFGMTILLVVPWLLAIKHRHVVALHARYMICTAFAVIDPIVGRISYFYFPPLPAPDYAPLVSYTLSAGVLIALIIREREQRVGRGVFPFVLVLATVVYAGFFTLAKTDAWLAFIRWFGSLALT